MVNRRMYILLVALAGMTMTARTQEAVDAFRQATRLTDPAQRIAALRDALTRYPDSPARANAWNALFSTYAHLENEPEALNAAHEFITAIPGDKTMAYNNVAWNLAERNLGLDTAMAYIDRAVDQARKSKSPRLGMILDTKAFVHYQLGDPATAYTIQLDAMPGNERDPEYVYHLGLYEWGTGKKKEALASLVRAMILGDLSTAGAKFNEWCASDPDAASWKAYTVTSLVGAHIDTVAPERKYLAASAGALVMARTDTDLSGAEKLARKGVTTLPRDASVEQEVAVKKNLAVVLAARQKTKEALSAFKEIEQYMTPWDAEGWDSYGSLLEKEGRQQDAMNAYVNGLLVGRNPKLAEAYQRVYAAVHGSSDGAEKHIETVREELAAFNPGHGAQKSSGGRVVLAELFTGSECGPCQAADYAFDALAEYYPRASVVILEYHVHVPGPDPMTTVETWDRYKKYGDTGTPTVYIDGKTRVAGGGPKYLKRNRFYVYQKVIDERAKEKPGLTIGSKVNAEGDNVSVNVSLTDLPRLKPADTLALHIALVENSVDYTGSNGVSKHLFVVRKLATGSNGTPITGSKKSFTSEATINVADVEQEIRAYLDDPGKTHAWPPWLRNFSGWKARPDKLNRDNLSVVVWVQHPQTSEVLNAAWYEVPKSLGMR